MALEDFFIKVARAANILFFFFAVFLAIKLSSGMPGDWRFLIIAGAAVSVGIVCGMVALCFRVSDQLEGMGGQLKSLLSAGRDCAGSLSGIQGVAKRISIAKQMPAARKEEGG